MPGERPAPVARALVVDDDPAILDFLSRVLESLGVIAQTAEDGAEAQGLLRAGPPFDLLFLDLGLPRVSGEELLQSMQQRCLMRPETVVVMSAAEHLAWPDVGAWSRTEVNLLPKPFVASDVAAIVRRALAGMRHARGGHGVKVLVAGVGLWAEGLSRVLERSGGTPIEVVLSREIFSEAVRTQPAVIVLGSAQLAERLEPMVRAIRREPVLAGVAIVAVMTEANPWSAAHLEAAGATRVLGLPQALPELATVVTRLAGLSRRVHPRVLLSSPVRLSRSDARLAGLAVDCSEGGLGVTAVPERPFLQPMQVEFGLPGVSQPVAALSEVVWARPGADRSYQVGVRFVSLDERARAQLRRYVTGRG